MYKGNKLKLIYLARAKPENDRINFDAKTPTLYQNLSKKKQLF